MYKSFDSADEFEKEITDSSSNGAAMKNPPAPRPARTDQIVQILRSAAPLVRELTVLVWAIRGSR